MCWAGCGCLTLGGRYITLVPGACRTGADERRGGEPAGPCPVHEHAGKGTTDGIVVVGGREVIVAGSANVEGVALPKEPARENALWCSESSVIATLHFDLTVARPRHLSLLFSAPAIPLLHKQPLPSTPHSPLILPRSKLPKIYIYRMAISPEKIQLDRPRHNGL